jgi:hypothetical protein
MLSYLYKLYTELPLTLKALTTHTNIRKDTNINKVNKAVET